MQNALVNDSLWYHFCFCVSQAAAGPLTRGTRPSRNGIGTARVRRNFLLSLSLKSAIYWRGSFSGCKQGTFSYLRESTVLGASSLLSQMGKRLGRTSKCLILRVTTSQCFGSWSYYCHLDPHDQTLVSKLLPLHLQRLLLLEIILSIQVTSSLASFILFL